MTATPKPVTPSPNRIAQRIVRGIEKDLNDRKGLHLKDCDEQAQADIRETWRVLIIGILVDAGRPIMTKGELRAAVIALVAEQMNRPAEEITPETRFREDLGADSLDAIELAIEAEDRFDTSIPDEDPEKILTVRQMIDYLAEKLEIADG